jgi:hypothetical protein
MNKIIFVVFSLLFTSGCFANAMDNALRKIESEWAVAEIPTLSASVKQHFRTY